jgi:hypothetical protein
LTTLDFRQIIIYTRSVREDKMARDKIFSRLLLALAAFAVVVLVVYVRVFPQA